MYQHHINTLAFAYTHTLMAFDVRPKVSLLLLLLLIEIGGIGWCLRALTSNRPMNEIDQQQYKRYKNEDEPAKLSFLLSQTIKIKTKSGFMFI